MKVPYSVVTPALNMTMLLKLSLANGKHILRCIIHLHGAISHWKTQRCQQLKLKCQVSCINLSTFYILLALFLFICFIFIGKECKDLIANKTRSYRNAIRDSAVYAYGHLLNFLNQYLFDGPYYFIYNDCPKRKIIAGEEGMEFAMPSKKARMSTPKETETERGAFIIKIYLYKLTICSLSSLQPLQVQRMKSS